MPEPVSTATATIRLPMSTPSGADVAAGGAIRVLPTLRAESQGACCGGACCAG